MEAILGFKWTDLKRIEAFSFVSLALLVIALWVAVLDAPIKDKIVTWTTPAYREVLAIAEADLQGNGQRLEVLKVRTQAGLFLEVYSPAIITEAGEQHTLLASTKLPDSRDGYFSINGAVARLAVANIDGGHVPDILVGSFDDDMVAHINVYRYLPEVRKLHLVDLSLP